MGTHDIDIVVLWVDGNDPAWQEEFLRYLPEEQRTTDTAVNRYRDWDLMRFWFRGIETCMPWIRRIHFVTWGHLPAWLNTDNPKLHVVNHRDFIPAEYLPVFNSRAIEIHLHRIPGLAEHFIYFNDDFFVLRAMKPQEFFAHGLPCDMAVMQPIPPIRLGYAILKDMEVINRHFKKRDVIREHPGKWFSLAYGAYLWYNVGLAPMYSFSGFRTHHQPQSYLKSIFQTVWEAEPEEMAKCASYRYRRIISVNQYIFRFWQFMTGRFRSYDIESRAALYDINDWSLPKILSIIRQRKKQILIINDDINSPFEKAQPLIREAFESIFPDKSSFER